ncbi:hypothetical protein LEP1GSC108_1247 [Leptospira weilii str. UI 13098]|uniref:Uncharacterized protein n=1 Tax=Leptospira weilii str. UI 13098 TaxID=1088542 RepID=M6Q695_9LEPT|nr:hypothetical protein LEP1GSC108_1247 [Leptospira weilii str. UI 13098]
MKIPHSSQKEKTDEYRQNFFHNFRLIQYCLLSFYRGKDSQLKTTKKIHQIDLLLTHLLLGRVNDTRK